MWLDWAKRLTDVAALLYFDMGNRVGCRTMNIRTASRVYPYAIIGNDLEITVLP
jgi:hypothetical protein